ncbi:MAG: hypothetical protein IT469_09930 [Pseudomonadales bacterium]|nr:hypothetical protein [Pseudomonadales bacterium]
MVHRPRPAVRLLLWLAALASAPSFAQTFPVDLDQRLHGMKIFASARSADAKGDVMILSIANLDERAARCDATFDIRVLPPKTYQRTLAAGDEIQIHHRVKRAVNRMTIELDCTPEQ